MDPQELSRRLVGIAKRAPGIIITKRTCWLDGEECSYGQPEGRFLLRPQQFCRPSIGLGTGCQKINDSEGLSIMRKEILRQEWERQLSKIVKENTLKLSGEVRAVADLEEADKQRKEVLLLAADLIEEREKDKANTSVVGVIREDDLAKALEDKLEITIE